MNARLPDALQVGNAWYSIDADYRNVLTILEAFGDPDLTGLEKAYICLDRLYRDISSIPSEQIRDAYFAATGFIAYGTHEDEPKRPKLLDWKRDEPILFPAINQAAGFEVRGVPFLHWWTFLGLFQSISPDSLLGLVLQIRQKKARGKKLEKWEREFERNNPQLCSLGPRKSVKEDMEDLFQALLEEGQK